MKQVRFQDLQIGDTFFVYGDIHLNYDYPKICECVKIDTDKGQEKDGINFLIYPSEKVDIKVNS